MRLSVRLLLYSPGAALRNADIKKPSLRSRPPRVKKKGRPRKDSWAHAHYVAFRSPRSADGLSDRNLFVVPCGISGVLWLVPSVLYIDRPTRVRGVERTADFFSGSTPVLSFHSFSGVATPITEQFLGTASTSEQQNQGSRLCATRYSFQGSRTEPRADPLTRLPVR